ncbi:hypothetical protein [Pseudomonas marginalis]|nr:hypothetical protein F3K50_14120 [Pseudomonas marginalis]
MSNEKNSPTQSASIEAVVDGQDQGFSPSQFSGSSSKVRMDADDSTYLAIDYGSSLTPGTHTLSSTTFKVKYKDPAGRDFTHAVAGTIVVKVVGNTHTGTLAGVKVDGTGSGAGSQVELSGTYLIVVS